MAGTDELPNDCRTDESSSTCHKYFHCSFPLILKVLQPFFAFLPEPSAFAGSSAYARTPSLTPVIVTESGTIFPAWQFSQYRPPISSAEQRPRVPYGGLRLLAGTVFHLNGPCPPRPIAC